MNEENDIVLNPNCSECIFTLKGMSRDEVINKLNGIGIFEVIVPMHCEYTGKICENKYLADVDNDLLPNFGQEGNGNLNIEEWADGISIHGEMNLDDYVYPTMLKIQDTFPQFEWEDINGSDVGNFLQWVVHGKPALKTTMDEKTREIHEKHILPQVREQLNILNPNCSEVVFSLNGMSREEVLAKIVDAGIFEISIPSHEFWTMGTLTDGKTDEMLADINNPNIPDFKYHSHLRIYDEFDEYGTCIVGNQHCQQQMFPTMLKIQRVLDGLWEGYGGGSVEDFRDWVNDDVSSQPLEDIQDDDGREKRKRYFEDKKDDLVNEARSMKKRFVKKQQMVENNMDDPDSEM